MENLKRQVTEVAILYYKENMTQQQIAEKLGLTRQTISKLLKIAIEERIVQITINDPEKQNIAECIIAKNRHGSTGKVTLGWYGQFTKFTTLDTKHE